MNTYLDCVPCFLRQSLEAARATTEKVDLHERIVRDVLLMTAELRLDRPPALVGQAIHRRLRELTGVNDPYRAAKKHFNRLALEALPELAQRVRNNQDPLLAAARFAVAANAIDMGADLIIAKGQGNFETLSGAGENIAFWFKVKCPVVARELGLPLGTQVLLPPTGRAPASARASEAGKPKEAGERADR